MPRKLGRSQSPVSKVREQGDKGERGDTGSWSFKTHLIVQLHVPTHTHTPSPLSHTGAAAVFVDLEKGAITILESCSDETAKTVEHKYILPLSPPHLVLSFGLSSRVLIICCSLQVWGECRQGDRQLTSCYHKCSYIGCCKLS